MKNKLTDLNDHLFAELERLGDEDLTGEQLNAEINRAKAVADIASQVISNGTLVLKARLAADGALDANFNLPAMLGD